MLLENDAFTIRYEMNRVSLAGIMEKIRALGYRPELVKETGQRDQSLPMIDDLPEPIAEAWLLARREDKILVLDFFASWCGPCKILDRDVLGSPRVQRALRNFVFLKIDTDRYPKAANHFRVRALPTLIMIDPEGSVRNKQVGLITADALVERLEALSAAVVD